MTRIAFLFGLVMAFPVEARADDEYFFTESEKNHWAWLHPKRPRLPAVSDRNWAKSPIDRFILARMESSGLQPTVSASRRQLLRRVTFDLLGLPPTPEELDAFVNDQSVDAWEKVVDRLLASPHYGERWGRHWLDLARYAETNGFEHDEIRPNAWRYRDYVIRSFNEDKPYDQFVREQLAGDELDPDNPEALIATGFNLLGPDMTDSSDQALRRQNTLNDMTDTTGLVFLGLTLACARCHDHKFEPIFQVDYYRFQAFFTPASFRRDLPIADRKMRQAYEKALAIYEAQIQPTREALTKLEAPYRKKLYEAKLARLGPEAQLAHRTSAAKRTATQKELVAKTTRLLRISAKAVFNALGREDRTRYEKLQKTLKTLQANKPASLPVALGLRDSSKKAPKTYLLERGELHARGGEVQTGFPVVFHPENRIANVQAFPLREATTGRRSALARWVTGRDNPLTARVIVNRLWQHHFGRGIVPTPSDFGLRGQAPTHPQLLDWLAVELIESGWSLKQMHKQMLLSATYRQSTSASEQTRRIDPENRLFSRMNRLRLEGEAIRDSLLAISGRLNRKMAGISVFPPTPSEAVRGSKGGWKVSADPHDHVRRSMYIFARRNLRFPFLETFDLPDSNLSCPKREQSTTAPQALALLNSSDVERASRELATRLIAKTKTEKERISRAFLCVLGRRPTREEQMASREFLQDSPLSELCRALFNTNEFVYLD